MASGGESNFIFVAEPDSALQCVICKEIAENPWQHGQCGRLLCKECLGKLGRDKPCPNCRRERPQYFEDNRSKRDINALRVKCSNMDRECEWEGTVGTLKKHVAICKFALVCCPNRCGDNTEKQTAPFFTYTAAIYFFQKLYGDKDINHFMRKDIEKHLENDCPNRDYECVYCGEKGTYAKITQVHDQKCEKKILDCPNAECVNIMHRQHINEHVRTECHYTMISCKYKDVGCATELKRKDMAAHEQDDKLHLHMALETVTTLREESRTLKNNKWVTYILPLFQSKWEAKTPMLFNLPFYTHLNGYHMTLKVYAYGDGDGEGTHVSVYASMLDGKYDATLKWPFIGSITIALLNQLEDKHHEISKLSFTTEKDAHVGSTWGFPTFISHTNLAYNEDKNTQYLKDDTLYFRVTAEVTDHKPWLE